MKTIKTNIKQFQPKYKGTKSKIKPGVSLTVPDQNLTIAQLLDRHSRGIPLGASQKTGEYFDTEIPRHEDLTDALEHKQNLIKKEQELNKEIRKQTDKKPRTIKEKTETSVSEAEKPKGKTESKDSE